MSYTAEQVSTLFAVAAVGRMGIPATGFVQRRIRDGIGLFLILSISPRCH
jgi:hypothetical protein